MGMRDHRSSAIGRRLGVEQPVDQVVDLDG
jgi:hypothetical protein